MAPVVEISGRSASRHGQGIIREKAAPYHRPLGFDAVGWNPLKELVIQPFRPPPSGSSPLQPPGAILLKRGRNPTPSPAKEAGRPFIDRDTELFLDPFRHLGRRDAPEQLPLSPAVTLSTTCFPWRRALLSQASSSSRLALTSFVLWCCSHSFSLSLVASSAIFLGIR